MLIGEGAKVKVVKEIYNQIDVGDIGLVEHCFREWPSDPNTTYIVKFDKVDYPFYFRQDEIKETGEPQEGLGNE